MKISHKFKTRYWLPLLLLAVVLLGLRLYLPTWLKNHANEVLAEIPGYHGSIQDVDVSLWRGAYVAENLQLFREGAQTEVPFLPFQFFPNHLSKTRQKVHKWYRLP